jgi:hypothetical protein
MNLQETWVVACRLNYLDTHLVSDELFASESDADEARALAHEAYLRMPLRTSDQSGYAVMRLADFMDAQCQEAVEAERIGADRR